MGAGTTAPIVFKSVQLVDFASATNILGTYDAEGVAFSPLGILAPGVNAAASAEIINMIEPLDLAKFGLNATTNPSNSITINEKMEGMALVPDLSTPRANDFFLFTWEGRFADSGFEGISTFAPRFLSSWIHRSFGS